MPLYDAVAVFGTRLQDDGMFLPFVYQEIDYAIRLVETGQAPQLIFCGSHWAGESFRGVRECDVAEGYIRESYPHMLAHFRKEERSTTVPENWLYMKLNFPDVRRVHHVTIAPLLPRMQFCGDWIYGDDGALTHEALPWPDDAFGHEPQLLRDAKCIFTIHNSMKRGDHTFLLQEGSEVSKWQELWRDHCCNCQLCYG